MHTSDEASSDSSITLRNAYPTIRRLDNRIFETNMYKYKFGNAKSLASVHEIFKEKNIRKFRAIAEYSKKNPTSTEQYLEALPETGATITPIANIKSGDDVVMLYSVNDKHDRLVTHFTLRNITRLTASYNEINMNLYKLYERYRAPKDEKSLIAAVYCALYENNMPLTEDELLEELLIRDIASTIDDVAKVTSMSDILCLQDKVWYLVGRDVVPSKK